MTLILNTRETFAAQSLAGFVAANAARVRSAPGGVVRSTRRRPGKVAVVVGGGSGHYPAFAGMVGTGLADGAVCGDVFASPSTRQVMDVCRAVDQGAGVWLSFGNYAGDVLNFSAAATRLRAQGMDLEVLAVTDDVASAGPDERHRRRGVAGDLVVFKVAGAAAEEGYDLAAVAGVATRANDRTRTFGVAFAGCTLPGADAPLFSLDEGTMALGLGVHGEPGVGDAPLPTADELAQTLVETVLADAPGGSARVAVLLNGLGSVKYEELFVLWDSVRPLLEAAGLDPVAPEVGELMTSLDMAGCSLTLTWLDDELERLWLAPADSPAYRRTLPEPLDPTPVTAAAAPPAIRTSGEAGHRGARCVLSALTAVDVRLQDLEDELGRLDAVAGDGDHGRGMARGSAACVAAAREAVDAGADAPTTLRLGGEAWADRAGGTSGALWGAGLLAAAEALPQDVVPTGPDVVSAVVAAWVQVTTIGGAQVGDKTLVDALEPFARTLRRRTEDGDDLHTAWAAAASAADEGATSTRAMAARMGRSRVLGEKSLGTPDPGATSLAACMRALEPLMGQDERTPTTEERR
ncbi:MAG: dihydroxyacetone kinase family protein [Lapillicoccus sp.]